MTLGVLLKVPANDPETTSSRLEVRSNLPFRKREDEYGIWKGMPVLQGDLVRTRRGAV
jgi:hypothetical protein